MQDPQTPAAARGPRAPGLPAPTRFDVALVTAVGAGYAAILLQGATPGSLPPVLLSVLLALAPLLWRTHAPVLALVLVMVAQAAAFLLVPGFTVDDLQFTFVSVLIALGAVASRRPLWTGLAAFAGAWAYQLATMVAAFPWQLAWSTFATGTVCAIAWGLGRLAHRHRARILRLEDDHEAAGEAVRAERARIASELNGIIRVAVYGMLSHAAAARRWIRREPDRASDAFAAVEAAGVEAMHELRRLLHLLHDDAGLALPTEAATPESRATRLGRALHVDRGDVVVAACGVFAGVVLAAASFPAATAPLAGAYLGVVLWVLVWRRRFPVPVFLLVIAGHAGAVLLFNRGQFVFDSWSGYVPLLIALAAVAGGTSPWISVPALVVAYGYLLPTALVYPDVLASNLMGIGALALAVWITGVITGRRRRRIRQLEAAAERAARAVAAERARLTYDLHDVIGHAITVMVLQAAGARRILAQDRDRAAAALEPIEQAGADALRELDELVGVLRRDDLPSAPSAPEQRQRGLADVDELVGRTRHLVAHAAVTAAGEPARLEPSVDLAAYCVVREALANAVKHDGADARIAVAVRWDDGAVRVRVGSAAGSRVEAAPAELSGGFGLAHLRERVRLAGGELSWAAEDGGFAVEAVFPLVRAAAALSRA